MKHHLTTVHKVTAILFPLLYLLFVYGEYEVRHPVHMIFWTLVFAFRVALEVHFYYAGCKFCARRAEKILTEHMS